MNVEKVLQRCINVHQSSPLAFFPYDALSYGHTNTISYDFLYLKYFITNRGVNPEILT